jgi:Domain of unknown function (DUF4115)
MSTPVLVAIILIAVGCVTAVTRLRLADRRSVAAHHRALETMGRLVAQHPAPEPVAPPEQPAGQAHVRVVGPDEPEQVASPDTLRSRSRIRGPRSPDYVSWGDVAPVEPSLAAELQGDLSPPAALAGAEGDGAALAPGPTLLHFDALASAPPAAKATVTPLGGPGGRHRPWRRSRLAVDRQRRRRRSAHPTLRRAALGGAILILLAGGAAGGLLVTRDHPAPRPQPPRATPTTAPPIPPTTALAAAAPVLVNSGVGYSEYRLSGSATVVLTASGLCWVEIRQSGPSGPLLYEGDLVAGETKGTPGSTWVRLGDPSHVTVQVNGVTISPPSLVAGEPYNLQFE